MASKTTFLTSIKNITTQWYNIIVFIVLIGTGIGNYMVSNYRLEDHDKRIATLDTRLKVVEGVNYELLLSQLEAIQHAETELNKKLDKTNERIDNVLEILLSK